MDLQKEEFEDSLKKNDLQRISLCACLAKVLSQESENSLDKVQDVHGKELRKKLLDLEELMFDKVNNNYEDYISVIFLFICLVIGVGVWFSFSLALR